MSGVQVAQEREPYHSLTTKYRR